jgi:hypothetical protein
MPKFLVGKSLDVQLYTPELVKLFRSSKAASDAVAALGGELQTFEGDYFALSAADIENAPPTALAKTVPAACRASLLPRVEQCRAALGALKDATNRTQRIFWLGNHTSHCDWSTVDQLLFREEHDTDADGFDPNFKPLETWDDQVKAAIFGAKQDKLGLTKDGKALVGPICPRLLALQSRGGGGSGGQGRGTPGYGGDRNKAGGYGPPGSPYGQAWRTNTPGQAGRGGPGPRGRGRGRGRGGGKENRHPRNNGPPAAAGAPAQP